MNIRYYTWRFCAAGNIVRTRIDENGEVRHGTKEFIGGTKVYLKGKIWRKDHKTITVIGLNRYKKYIVTRLPVELIENVRFQTVQTPKVLRIMNNFEFFEDWWKTTADDKRDCKRFVEEWNIAAEERKASVPAASPKNGSDMPGFRDKPNILNRIINWLMKKE